MLVWLCAWVWGFLRGIRDCGCGTICSYVGGMTHLRTLNITPISDFIYHLTDKFFGSCPAHPNPLIRSIGNYSLADLHRQYKKIAASSMLHEAKIAYYASDAAILFPTTIGPAVAKAT